MSDKIIFFSSSLERLSSLSDWAGVAVSAAEERRGRRDAERREGQEEEEHHLGGL